MNWHRGIIVALCVALVGSALGQEMQRGEEVIRAEMKKLGEEKNELMPSPFLIGDAKFRKEHGEKLASMEMKTANLFGELAAIQSKKEGERGGEKERAESKDLQKFQYDHLGTALALGSKDAEKMLTEAAAGQDARQVMLAKTALAMGHWLANSEDIEAQQKVLNDYVAVVKAHPEDEIIIARLFNMVRIAAANKKPTDRVAAVLKAHTKGVYGEQAKRMVDTFSAAEKPQGEAKRKREEVQADLNEASKKLGELMPSEKMLGDAGFRKEHGAKVAAVFMQMANLHEEEALIQKDVEMGWAGPTIRRLQMMGYAMGMGDKDAAKILTETAAGKSTVRVNGARSALLMGNWLLNSEDGKAQQKVLDDYAAFLETNPESLDVQTLVKMMYVGPANTEMPGKVMEVMKAHATGQNAAYVKMLAEQMDETKKNR